MEGASFPWPSNRGTGDIRRPSGVSAQFVPFAFAILAHRRTRAEPDTGRLVVVRRHGELRPVVDRRGQELVLDRPVSLFVGDTAYVLSVTGFVYRVDNL